MLRAMCKVGRFWWVAATAGAVAISTAGSPAVAATGTGGYSPRPVHRADAFAGGQAMFTPPAGENGLVNAAQLKKFLATGQRPPHSQDQLAPYENLEFGYPSLTNAALHNYYLDESFGVKPGQIIRTEHPASAVPVGIYRDTHDIPHRYGKTDAAPAFAARSSPSPDPPFP